MVSGKISAIASIINFILISIGYKKRLINKAQKAPRSTKAFVSKGIQKRYQVSVDSLEQRIIATLKPKNSSGNKHIIFFHGGGYVFEITSLHWQFIENIIKKMHCRVSVLNYPLAPEADFTIVHQWVKKAYQILNSKYPDDEIILMGDSAGGGLAMAFAQTISEEQELKQPDKLVLLSPWLDMSMSHPGIDDKEKTDHLLSREFLDYCTSVYAKGGNSSNYFLSPINGPLDKLPPTAVFYGSYELFEPDCKQLQNLCKSVESQFTFFEYFGMQHDWLLFPIPEAKKALSEIHQFIVAK